MLNVAFGLQPVLAGLVQWRRLSGRRDAMRLKDAASCSFDGFHIDLKERPDDPVSSIDLQRTVRSWGSGAEPERLALGDLRFRGGIIRAGIQSGAVTPKD